MRSLCQSAIHSFLSFVYMIVGMFHAASNRGIGAYSTTPDRRPASTDTRAKEKDEKEKKKRVLSTGGRKWIARADVHEGSKFPTGRGRANEKRLRTAGRFFRASPKFEGLGRRGGRVTATRNQCVRPLVINTLSRFTHLPSLSARRSQVGSVFPGPSRKKRCSGRV